MIEMIMTPKDINPICLALGLDDFKYLIVHPKNRGGNNALTAYNPICVIRLVEIGFSRTFFPHVGQK
jgi:hypothetical protein